MKRKSIWIILILVPAVLVLGFILWASAAPAPMPEAIAALESNTQVSVESGEWYEFFPQENVRDTGMIFYPGGKVDPRSYAPAAQEIAAVGYPVVIVSMPLNLAFFAPNQATEVMAAFPDIAHWVLAGHSLGGAMAGRYAVENQARLSGLAFWAAYPSDADDLSGTILEVSSIFGTLDGLATIAEIEASRPRLPPGTRWVAIEGGNHAQFGWYGPQSGDLAATISRQDQQKMIVDAMLDLLQTVDGSAP